MVTGLIFSEIFDDYKHTESKIISYTVVTDKEGYGEKCTGIEIPVY
jgi:hypothetical protein